MATKRLTLELSTHQYEILQREAKTAGITISGCLRRLIEELHSKPKSRAVKNYQADPLYKRLGSFDGPEDLAEHHNGDLYR